MRKMLSWVVFDTYRASTLAGFVYINTLTLTWHMCKAYVWTALKQNLGKSGKLYYAFKGADTSKVCTKFSLKIQ